jgi:hypothetical protein
MSRLAKSYACDNRFIFLFSKNNFLKHELAARFAFRNVYVTKDPFKGASQRGLVEIDHPLIALSP